MKYYIIFNLSKYNILTYKSNDISEAIFTLNLLEQYQIQIFHLVQ